MTCLMSLICVGIELLQSVFLVYFNNKQHTKQKNHRPVGAHPPSTILRKTFGSFSTASFAFSRSVTFPNFRNDIIQIASLRLFFGVVCFTQSYSAYIMLKSRKHVTIQSGNVMKHWKKAVFFAMKNSSGFKQFNTPFFKSIFHLRTMINWNTVHHSGRNSICLHPRANFLVQSLCELFSIFHRFQIFSTLFHKIYLFRMSEHFISSCWVGEKETMNVRVVESFFMRCSWFVGAMTDLEYGLGLEIRFL